MPDNVLFIGHSLVGPIMPRMFNVFMQDAGQPDRAAIQVINGSSLFYNWENGALAQGVNAREVLPGGTFDAVIVTEAIPLDSHLLYSDTHGYAQRYFDLATGANPDTQFYIYETWHGIGEYPSVWRDRLDTDLSKWEGIADHIDSNAPTGAKPALIIPAGQAMARLYDAIEAGQVPGLTDIRDLFADDIHLNDTGNWFIATLQAATITGVDPATLPIATTNQWGNPFGGPDQAMADALVGIVTQTLNTYNRDGRNDVPTDTGGGGDDGGDDGTGDGDPPVNDAEVSLGFGLTGIADWSTATPFLDVFKSSRPFFGHEPGRYGGVDHETLQQAGVFDENGWPTHIPEGVDRIGTVILTELPADMTDAAGRYRVTWEGEGEVRVGLSATNITYGQNEIWFDYAPNGSGLVNVDIHSTDPNGTGNHVRGISVVKQDNIAAVEAGQVFNPKWLDIIDDAQSLRFMDWMATNNSQVATSADAPSVQDASWALKGVPLEIMVQLANLTGTDPWFNIPHLADETFIRDFVTQVRDTLNPALKAYFEFSNEVWNFQFGQAQHSHTEGQARFPGEGTAWVQNYAADAVVMAEIIDEVYGAGSPRAVQVIATQTGWIGLEDAILEAPEWVAEDPANNAAPHSYFDAYAITGYFDGGLGRGSKPNVVKTWLADSLAQAEAAADAQGLSGAARDAYVDAHRYDLAVTRAVAELRDGSITGDAGGSLADLRDQFIYHKAVTDARGLELIMYEGGTHIVGVGSWQNDEDLTGFFTHLNYTPEMGVLYTELLAIWDEVGGSLFNAFTAVGGPSRFGSWGHLRHLDDSNPRMDAITGFLNGETGPIDLGVLGLQGISAQHETLVADLSDLDGIAQTAPQFQWQRDGIDIAGANDAAYGLGQEDVNARISLVYRFVDANGQNREVASDPTGPVVNVNDTPIGQLIITGAMQEDAALSVDISGISDVDGIDAATLALQWTRDEETITGATGATYLLTQDDVGAVVSVELRYTDGFGTAERVTGSPTAPVQNVNDAPQGAIDVLGLAQEGEILTADISGISDADGIDAATMSVKWFRDGVEIPGATALTYQIIRDDIGAVVTVALGYVDAHGAVERVESAGLGPVVHVNTPPQGALEIIGTPVENATLVVDASGVIDADGIDHGTMAMQWLRNGEAISGATENSLVLGQEDVGATISATLRYTDGYGTIEEVTGSASGPVQNVNDAPEGELLIQGALEEDATLSVDPAMISDRDGIDQGTIAFQWLRNGIDLAGETGTTYRLGQEDVGAYFSARMSFRDAFGADEQVLSRPTAQVRNINDDPVGRPVIAGEMVQGATLTANTLGVSDDDGIDESTGLLQWLRNGVALNGANNPTYVLTQADVGSVITVEYSFADLFGMTEVVTSRAADFVENINDAPQGDLWITGMPEQGGLLSVDWSTISDLDGIDPATVSIQWWRGQEAIAGATQAGYRPTQADVGADLRVSYSYTDLEGTQETVESQPLGPIRNVNDAPQGQPRIFGDLREGVTLAVTTADIFDPDGMVDGTQTLQWLRDGEEISGASGPALSLGQQDVGTVISVRVSYVDGFGAVEEVVGTTLGQVVNVNDLPRGGLGIGGQAIEGATLTLNAGDVTDADGIVAGTGAYQWLRDGVEITGAVQSSYTLTQADVAARISASYRYLDRFGTQEQVVADPTAPVLNVNDSPEGRITIEGAPLEGATLTADVTGVVDPDGIDPATASLQWLRDGSPIAGANGATYVLDQADVGSRISVDYRYVDLFGQAERVTAQATADIGNVNDAPTGQPVILGPRFENSILTVDLSGIGDADGIDPATASLQWIRNGLDIAGATEAEYVLTQEDVNAAITVVYAYVDQFGSLEQVQSAPTGPISNVNNLPTGMLTITGRAEQGATLSVDVSAIRDPDGMDQTTGAIRWLRDGVEIAGATEPTYVLTQADVGAIVTASYSYLDAFGAAEQVVGDLPTPIANANDTPTGTVTIAGTARQYETLSIMADGIADADGIVEATIAYQWLRDGIEIAGATGQSHVLNQQDVGAVLSARYSYVDLYGTNEELVALAPVRIGNVDDAPTGTLRLDGGMQQGDTLTLDISQIDDLDGIDPATVEIQWLRDGQVIPGASGPAYLLGQPDVGAQITASYRFADSFGGTGSFETAPTGTVQNINDAPTGVLQVSGTPRENETLQTDGSTISDADGMEPGTVSLQWMRDGIAITGATAAAYRLSQVDAGREITVIYSYTDDFGVREEVGASLGIIENVNDPTVGALGVSGSGDVGASLTASAAEISDQDGIDPDTIQWLWWRQSPDGTTSAVIPGALGEVHELTASDSGHLVRPEFRYHDTFGNAHSTLGAAIYVNSDPTGPVTIAGTVMHGQTVTADHGGVVDAEGIQAGTIAYQWYRDGEVLADATGPTYALTESDVGGALTVRFSYTDERGFFEVLTSAPALVASAAMRVEGTDLADDLVGGIGNDTLVAGEGADRLNPGAGDDLLDGGPGIDTALLAGDQAAYTLAIGPAGTLLTDRRPQEDGGQGQQTLLSIEFLDFDHEIPLFGDTPMQLDLFAGAADIATDQFVAISELYIAYFNRAPDALGLYYWASEFSKGFSLQQMATSFFSQPETRATYAEMLSLDGQSLTDVGGFVTAVYGNVLGRAPDSAGFDYWVDRLENHAEITPANFILSLIYGAKYPSDPTPQTALDQAYLADKVDIGTYFAAIQGLSNIALAQTVMQIFDGSQESLQSAVDQVDAFSAQATSATEGEFLFKLVGVLDSPFVDM